MKKILYTFFLLSPLFLMAQTTIEDISSGDSMLYVRQKVNTLIGYGNGMFNDASFNINIGSYSQANSVDIERCIAVGADAQRYKKMGNYTVAIGYESQYSDKYGVRNTSLGYKSLLYNETGFDNTAIGYKSLQLLAPTDSVITNYIDAGGGFVKVVSPGHGLSNDDVIRIYGTGDWTNHAYENNFDSTHTVSSVSTDTFQIQFRYIESGELTTKGYWTKYPEGCWNTGLGVNSGGNLTTGYYNLAVGANTTFDDPAGNYQLNIGNTIKGYMPQDGQKWISIDGVLKLEPQESAPDTPEEGWIYSNSIDHHLYYYNGSTWIQLDN